MQTGQCYALTKVRFYNTNRIFSSNPDFAREWSGFGRKKSGFVSGIPAHCATDAARPFFLDRLHGIFPCGLVWCGPFSLSPDEGSKKSGQPRRIGNPFSMVGMAGILVRCVGLGGCLESDPTAHPMETTLLSSSLDRIYPDGEWVELQAEMELPSDITVP